VCYIYSVERGRGKEVSMPLSSTRARYGSVAVTLHWLTALAILFVFVAGFTAANTGDPARLPQILAVHVGLGLLVVILTLLRLLWWVAADRRPAPVGGQPAWQEALAWLVHRAIYLVILLMGTSGLATLVLSGAVPHLLAGQPLPDFSTLVPRLAHGIMAWLLLALLGLHVLAALYHQFVRRDYLLARMGLGGEAPASTRLHKAP
jgi:cytochrome b561